MMKLTDFEDIPELYRAAESCKVEDPSNAMFDCGKFLLVACKYIEFKQVVRFYNPPLVSNVADQAKPILELKPSSLKQLSNCNEK